MQVPGFNEGKWIAVGDEEGFVSIVNGAAELPKAFRPGSPDEPRPQAQWLAHHNAIFDLAWCQVIVRDAKIPVSSNSRKSIHQGLDQVVTLRYEQSVTEPV